MSFYLLNQTILFDSLTGKLFVPGSKNNKQLRSNEWKLLQLFIEHAGEDLSTDSILTAIWHNKRAKSSVATSIKNLRCALNDKVNEPAFIQTQVMTGYAFIAATAEISEQEFKQRLRRQTQKTHFLKSFVHRHRFTLLMSGLNGLSLILITLALNSLYANGAFDTLLNKRETPQIVPMVIHQSTDPNADSYEICTSLVKEAEQSATLQYLPISPRSLSQDLTTLTWSSKQKEVLLCHLPNTK